MRAARFGSLSGLAAVRFVAVLALLAGCRPGRPAWPVCEDCNVVLVSVDTLRADHVGAWGYPKPTTPNIDALAARGVVFENAIAQSSWTRPAHMSIFTGLHPREHGFVSLNDRRPLDQGVPTLATELKKRGYQTAAFSGGVNMSASFGFDRGFDTWRVNGREFRDNLEDLRWWLSHEAREPFFLFLHGYEAHTPYRTDPVDRAAVGLPPKPPEAGFAETCRAEGADSRIDPYVAEYDGAVHRADRYVGKMLAAIEAGGFGARTVFVLLSDHGEEFLEHGRCFHLATVHREVLHVPLVVAAPGLPPRRVRETVAASVTIAPTVMDLLGVEAHPFAGASLASAAVGGPVPSGPVVSETERGEARRGDGHVRALQRDDAKIVDWTSRGLRSVYDVTKDPMEREPLGDSPSSKALLTELSAALSEWTVQHPPRFEPRRGVAARSAPPRAGKPASKAPGSAGGTGAAPGADDERARPEDLDELENELGSLGYLE